MTQNIARLSFRAAAWLGRRLPPALSHYVAYLYPQSAAVRNDIAFTVPMITGSIYTGSTGDRHEWFVALRGYNDYLLLAAAAALCKAGDTVVEVGANTGTETIALADMVGSGGAVISVEPLPSNIKRLRRALTAAHVGHVAVVEGVVASAGEEVLFVLPPSEFDSGSGYVDQGHEDSRQEPRAGEHRIHVRSVSLDDLLSPLSHVALVTIDVEGGEVAVLFSGRAELRRLQPALIVEAHDGQLVRSGTSIAKLHAALQDLGYGIWRMSRLGLRAPRLGSSSHGNWLCLPPSLRGQRDRVHRTILLSGALLPMTSSNPLRRSALRA